MTTRELLYIKTIADEGSMTRAAQKLFVTQPSLSHCVMNIEQQLGTRLFTRTSGGLVLTYAGEKYYRMACEVLRVYAAFESEISEERALAQGRVTVGSPIIWATTAPAADAARVPQGASGHRSAHLRGDDRSGGAQPAQRQAGILPFCTRGRTTA